MTCSRSREVLQEVLNVFTGNKIDVVILSEDGEREIYFRTGGRVMKFHHLEDQLKSNMYLIHAYSDLKDDLHHSNMSILQDGIRQLKYSLLSWEDNGKLNVEHVLSCPLLRKHIMRHL